MNLVKPRIFFHKNESPILMPWTVGDMVWEPYRPAQMCVVCSLQFHQLPSQTYQNLHQTIADEYYHHFFFHFDPICTLI
jgi:hypothetical protein